MTKKDLEIYAILSAVLVLYLAAMVFVTYYSTIMFGPLLGWIPAAFITGCAAIGSLTKSNGATSTKQTTYGEYEE